MVFLIEVLCLEFFYLVMAFDKGWEYFGQFSEALPDSLLLKIIVKVWIK